MPNKKDNQTNANLICSFCGKPLNSSNTQEHIRCYGTNIKEYDKNWDYIGVRN